MEVLSSTCLIVVGLVAVVRYIATSNGSNANDSASQIVNAGFQRNISFTQFILQMDKDSHYQLHETHEMSIWKLNFATFQWSKVHAKIYEDALLRIQLPQQSRKGTFVCKQGCDNVVYRLKLLKESQFMDPNEIKSQLHIKLLFEKTKCPNMAHFTKSLYILVENEYILRVHVAKQEDLHKDSEEDFLPVKMSNELDLESEAVFLNQHEEA